MNNNTKTILALLSGALAGVALGIFFSSGKGTKMKDSAEDKFDSMTEKDAMSEFKRKLYQKASRNNGTGHGQGKKNKQHS